MGMKFVAQIYEAISHIICCMTFITSVNILNITHNIKIFHKTTFQLKFAKEKTGIFNISFFVKKVILKFISIILVSPIGKGRRDYTLA
jgi:ABC-type phosphate transport system permease subunit